MSNVSKNAMDERCEQYAGQVSIVKSTPKDGSNPIMYGQGEMSKQEALELMRVMHCRCVGGFAK